MTNDNTTYWKRVIAHFDREMNDDRLPDSTRSMAARGKRVAEHGQKANDRVAELEAEVKRLRSALSAITLVPTIYSTSARRIALRALTGEGSDDTRD
ncbi:hypothetical protein I532_04185 [Brevibacillus borstelensis AK1]|uniref:Uncharacterized protein n=1 Tax=Brevibacillus borstelensis AK1 TaxID=1300222 RepID=M8EH29_9BACL|nr:hypothetical protein [Brevibacillus borstelensis]EMT54775.1 hypothetical protein I532_04185 [Brevibacillus borstelensis AK1]